MKSVSNLFRKNYFYLLFLLPVLILLPFLGDFAYIKGSQFSDLAVSHYPNAIYLQQSILTNKEIPLWSDTILSGYPFSADPLSGLYYPPGWLALLFPLPFGLNLVTALHLIFAGLGMYFFLKAEGLSVGPSLFGALAFEALPKLFAHLGAGHLSLIFAAAWTPWLLLAEKKAVNAPKRPKYLPGLALGAVALADIRWALPVGLFWLVYSLRQYGPGLAGAGIHWRARLVVLTRWLAWVGLNGLLGMALAAVQILPLIQYASLSTRASMSAQDVLAYSMPVLQLIGLWMPTLGNVAEWVVYPGMMVMGLVFVGLFIREKRTNLLFWVLAALVCALIGLGDNLPGMQALAGLPGVSLLRVPTRMWFLGGFSLAVGAAFALQALRDEPAWTLKVPRIHPMLILTGIGMLVVLLALAVTITTQKFSVSFWWGAAAWVAGLTLLTLYQRQRIRPDVFMWAACALLLFDLSGVNLLGLEFRPAGQVLAEGKIVAEKIQSLEKDRFYRVYSPSYSIPQQTAAHVGLELADGVNPLQLASLVKYMEKASGVLSEGYSVTLPPFMTGEPAKDNRAAVPDAAALGLLNVKYVTSEYDLKVDGLELVDQVGSTRIYRNLTVKPRVWLQDPASNLGEKIIDTPVFGKTANRIVVQAKGPGLLVLSEIDYPGWTAAVDGQATSIQAAGGLLRSVYIPAGEHVVKFEYRPGGVYLGLAISLLVGLIFVF